MCIHTETDEGQRTRTRKTMKVRNNQQENPPQKTEKIMGAKTYFCETSSSAAIPTIFPEEGNIFENRWYVKVSPPKIHETKFSKNSLRTISFDFAYVFLVSAFHSFSLFQTHSLSLFLSITFYLSQSRPLSIDLFILFFSLFALSLYIYIHFFYLYVYIQYIYIYILIVYTHTL